MFSAFDCAVKGVRKKEDPWNAIIAGGFTGGALAVRGGLKAIRNGAIGCAILLAVIEGVGIGMGKMFAGVAVMQLVQAGKVIRAIVASRHDRPSLVAEIACEIGAEIVEGAIAPGSDLNTVELARRYQTSRTPVREALQERWGRVDGVLHSIGFAPEVCLGDDFMAAQWDDVAVAMQISAFSLKTVATTVAPLMPNGGSIVGLDFDATVAWPAYDWMGVAKAALESTSRYLARELGPQNIRVNLVSAGPIETPAAGGIPGFDGLAAMWGKQAPLGWDTKDPAAVADTVLFLLSDLSRRITGEIVHVDGGFHAMGAPLRP
jgi:enoyl-[acyl-carrier protein] reductase I